MGTYLFYEAFIEDFGAGFRWRIYSNGEGMICFDYQEMERGDNGANWVSKPFHGLPIDKHKEIAEAISHIAKNDIV